jgi:hypothetical protein
MSGAGDRPARNSPHTGGPRPLTSLQVVLAARHDPSATFCPRRRTPNSSTSKEQEQRGKTSEAHRGRCGSRGSELRTSKPAARQALRAKAPPAESLVPAVTLAEAGARRDFFKKV